MRPMLTLVVSVLLFGCSSARAAGSHGLPPLSLADPDCRLSIRSISIQERAMFLRCNQREFRVYHPKNMYGFVAIRNSADALTFVRFFSSTRTYFLVDLAGMVEIRSAPDNADFFFVRQQLFMENFGEPVLSEHDDALEGKIFIITRYVVALDQHIYRIVEHVTARGNYDLKEYVAVAAEAAKFGVVHIGEH